MDYKEKKTNPAVFMNAMGLAIVSVALIIAFYFQLAKFELPCPLCLLQRVGLIITGFGFLFNIKLGLKNSHYGMVIIGCIVTGTIAIRQVFLHIAPGDAGYGSTFLGLHFYTWAVVSSILLLIYLAVTFFFSDAISDFASVSILNVAINLLPLVFYFLIAANLISTILECGSGQCADDPVFYELLAK